MARRARIDYEGALHHVMVRGLERRTIFQDEQDRESFLNRLETALEKTDAKCHAFALMPNHAHLLITSGKHKLSRAIQSLLTRYAGYYNWRHHRSGRLFQNRFKSILCDLRESCVRVGARLGIRRQAVAKAAEAGRRLEGGD